MKRHITLKLWLSVFFGGIWQLMRSIFGWNNKPLFWRVVGATIAVCLMFIAIRVGVEWYQASKATADCLWERYDGYISPCYKYRNNGKDSGKSYIYDVRTKKRLVTDLDWVAMPISGDSLMVVAKDGKRGYINRFSLEETIPFKYDAAWSFCEGVAAVCEGDSVYFIDYSGEPVNNVKFKRSNGYDNYAYHKGLAAIPSGGKYGIVDKSGNWIVEPKFDFICLSYADCWMATLNDKWGAIDSDGKEVVPCIYKDLKVNPQSGITVTLDDNVKQQLSYDGSLMNDFVVDNTFFITYYTDDFDAEGNQVQALADMMMYSAGPYYGLMTKGGIAITKPTYSSIECIRPGVYQCELPGTGESVVLNSKGEKIVSVE